MKSKTKNLLSEKALQTITAIHFPEASDARFSELSGGMFNAVYAVESTHFPRGEIVLKVGPGPGTEILTYEKEIMRTEVGVYGLLLNKPIPTPRVLACDFSRQTIPCDYFFIEKLRGRAWNDVSARLTKSAKRTLMKQLGRCNAAVHSVPGDWFGYIKDDARFRFDSWGEAFCAMMTDILSDGCARGFRLPSDAIERTTKRHLHRLNAVAKPKLVDFDMWAGNVFITREGGEYDISGVMDFERSFYGDPYADFTSAAFLFSNVEKEPDFRAGYEELSGEPLTVDEDDRIRMDLYRLYMAVILIAESYRYQPAYAWGIRNVCSIQIQNLLKKLNR